MLILVEQAGRRSRPHSACSTVVLANCYTLLFTTNSYRFRRSDRPAPESAPPLSSIISQPADVFGMDRSAALLSFMLRAVLRAVVVARWSAAGMVLWPCTVLGWLVVWFCAVIVPW